MEDTYYDLALMERIRTAEMPLIDSSDIYWETRLAGEDETNLGTDNERGVFLLDIKIRGRVNRGWKIKKWH